jgi:hypothetical protein
MIHALPERQARAAMTSRKIESTPSYPEEQACSAPMADKILGLFESVRVHHLLQSGRLVQTFWGELTEAQLQVLELLEVPASVYGH